MRLKLPKAPWPWPAKYGFGKDTHGLIETLEYNRKDRP